MNFIVSFFSGVRILQSTILRGSNCHLSLDPDEEEEEEEQTLTTYKDILLTI